MYMNFSELTFNVYQYFRTSVCQLGLLIVFSCCVLCIFELSVCLAVCLYCCRLSL